MRPWLDIKQRWTQVAICVALGTAIVLVSSPALASSDSEDVLARARSMQLARSPEWLRLVHYRANLWGGVASEVDGREFFLAPEGKVDPEAELEATIRAFFLPVVPGKEDDHAMCRFPARLLWLNERLHFEERPNAPSCETLARYGASSVESVSVVYSSNYLNNPASAFGHTFLRLKKKKAAGARQPNDRVDYGIDYTATPDTTNPLLYAFKGLTGMFPGYFRFHSFEFKLREYGNFEARDLWEYDLVLTPREVTLLTLHLWELSAAHIDFFYLTGNCSFQILAALEAAAIRLDLLSNVKAPVLPADTIKALVLMPGLVRGVAYRPSLRSQSRALVATLGPRGRDAVARLVLDSQAALPPGLSDTESAVLVDAAVLVLDATHGNEPIAGMNADLLRTRARLRERRSLFAAPAAGAAAMPVPRDKAPDLQHGSMRFVLGSGMTSQYVHAFATLGYRLALHDLVDPPDGEPELSQLQFLDTRLRYDIPRRSLTLDSLTFAEVVALNPLSRFEKALSWRARAFGVRLHDRGCPDCFAHGLDGALGGTVATENEHLAAFFMADTYVALAGALDGIGRSFVRIGIGPYAGLRVRLPAQTVGLLTGAWSYLPAQSLWWTYDLRATLRSRLGKDVALGVEAAMQPYSFEAQLSSYLYF